ncbi:hypothetical protein BVRB_5g111290 [Beta vulgaris subsp. vulgaris]|uniref:Uncharacterized protein n=1 Tax=Beta vulgaris subsp. vulgaris TaxID=3555 RepID=A0A0J8F5E4_BETVV|nr:hypothetical protein BVRB_5g111290 [Beta vulgaris subsp. vulgaris]
MAVKKIELKPGYLMEHDENVGAVVVGFDRYFNYYKVHCIFMFLVQEDGSKKIELKPGYLMEHDENVGAVVVGFDRYFNYYKVHELGRVLYGFEINKVGWCYNLVCCIHWMGVADNPLLDLIDKVRSWASLGKYNPSSVVSCDFNMAENSCCQCELKFSELCHKYSCLGCKRLLCVPCVRGSGPLAVIATSSGSKNGDHMEKVIMACCHCLG